MLFVFLFLDLQDDFFLMCNNAMVYNAPETIYYKAAKKLVQSGSKLLSPVSTSTSTIIKLRYCKYSEAHNCFKLINNIAFKLSQVYGM